MYDIKEIFRANSVPEALELLRAHPGAIPVCGGTDVMIHLKERKLRQAALVGIMDIASLQGIYLEQTGDLFIGPGTCFDSIIKTRLQERACRCWPTPAIRWEAPRSAASRPSAAISATAQSAQTVCRRFWY